MIASGETVTVPAGRVAVLPNVVVDGTLNIDGEVFIPSGSSVDFSNGIKIDGNNIVLSIPTSYHLLEGNLSVSNEVITNGFSTTLYTGNGGTQAINTGIDMNTQWGNDASETFGGLVWLKSRSLANRHRLYDTTRGAGNRLITDGTDAEAISIIEMSSFDTNGFSVGNDADTNSSSATYTSWSFQTTHRRTGVTNHGKAFTEHYNPFTGFTIIKYEGSGIAGHEIPHSLGRKLGFVATKNLTDAGTNWHIGYDGIPAGQSLILNATNALFNSLGTYTLNETNIVLPSAGEVNSSTKQWIAYGWANSYNDEAGKLIGNFEVGVYQGTGVAGNKVVTRGKPAWVMIKRLDSTGNWWINDNQRGDKELYANASSLEDSADFTDFIVDGFILKSTGVGENASGGQYLYMVVYDNDSGSGKSKYPRATDTSNVQINNAIIPLAHGVDSNGSKNSIVIANETITGLTYTQGKNYLYKTDTGYGVKPYEPRMLSSELVRRFAGEQPDYYDVGSNKWFNTDAGTDLVANGKFDVNTNGWTGTVSISGLSSSTISVSSGNLKILNATGVYGASQTSISTTIGKKYKLSLFVANGSGTLTSWVLKVGTTSTADGDIHSYSTATFGLYSVEFIAKSETTYITVANSNQASGYSLVDNVSVFPTVITPTTEITESRNYLNHIVHADQNGQVTYVEELPKIEYKDVIKANEFRGKNACTAWVTFDGTTTPPTIRDSYNVSSVVITATGQYDIYFATPMDNVNYSYSVTAYGTIQAGTKSASNYNTTIKFGLETSNASGTLTNYNSNTLQIFGGKN